MNNNSLFVLATLARHGEMHGHQIRRQAEIEQLEWWGEVRVGALYGTLHRLQGEGLIEAVRTEREGKFPARTVYGITADGRRELHIQRTRAMRDVKMQPDSFDLALAFSDDLTLEVLRECVKTRIATLNAQRETWRGEFRRAEQYLAESEKEIFHHFDIRIAAELEWHGALLKRLPEIVQDRNLRLAQEPSETNDSPGKTATAARNNKK